MIKGIQPALAEGGKIKIGHLGEERSKQSGKGTYRMPEKLDHFLVTKTSRDKSGNFEVLTDVMRLLPKGADGKVRELPILLHADEIDEVFPTSYALYAGRKLACLGDGESATRWNFQKNGDRVTRTGETKQVACTCEQLTERRCKPHGTLHCSIRVPGQGLAGAVFKLRTTSIITIRNIIGSLMHIRETVGVLRGIPLVLCLRPVEVTPEGKSTTVWVIHVELREENLVALQHQVIEAARMRASVQRSYDFDYKALVQRPGIDESDDEQSDIADEFYPDSDDDGEQAPDPSVVPAANLTRNSPPSKGTEAVRSKLFDNKDPREPASIQGAK